ncbi:hypothetical protein J6590_079944 [Homalodisca vitripennis]|nr:hypothetical protein J6590_079944 [Homalodisca vitripennis]
MLQTRAEIRDCHTPQDAMLELPRVRLEMGRNEFKYFGPQMYNSVPHSLKAYGYSSLKTISDWLWRRSVSRLNSCLM